MGSGSEQFSPGPLPPPPAQQQQGAGHAQRTSSDHQARTDECSAAAAVIVTLDPAAERRQSAGFWYRRAAAVRGKQTGPHPCHSQGSDPGEIFFLGEQAISYRRLHAAVGASGRRAAPAQLPAANSCRPARSPPPAPAVPPGHQLLRACASVGHEICAGGQGSLYRASRCSGMTSATVLPVRPQYPPAPGSPDAQAMHNTRAHRLAHLGRAMPPLRTNRTRTLAIC